MKLSAPLLIASPAIVLAQTLPERGRFDDEQLPLARQQLLEMVNAERSAAGLNKLELDDLASQVATEHARDMAQREFLSHWGSDGRTPYQRFALAGGTAAVRENVSSAVNIPSVAPDRVLSDLRDMHLAMLREVPPQDGHRKTILYPFHTHVGFGIALHNHTVKLDELYLGRYISFDPVAARPKANSPLSFSGKLLTNKYRLTQVWLCYEPLPARPDIEWLRVRRSVSFPDPYALLRPKAPAGTRYIDGTLGDFEWYDGRFRVEADLKKKAGIHTIIFWISRGLSDPNFAGAQVCILKQD